MITKIKVTQKIVCCCNKQYMLTYSLVSEDDCQYGIEVTCKYSNITEQEQILIGTNRNEALGILSLFAKETVFPIALKETFENL